MENEANKIIKEYKEGNDTITVTKCERCGCDYIHRSFLIGDGGDDVAWDEDNYCTNPRCPLSPKGILDQETTICILDKVI